MADAAVPKDGGSGENRTAKELPERLTRREHEVLLLIADGLSTKELA